MSTSSSHISFGLIQIRTLEFAIIKESYNGNDSNIEYSINTEFGVKTLEDCKIICSNEVTFLQDGRPFIKLKAACHFSVESDTWNQYVNKENHSIKFPKGFTDHLLMLSIGTLRGVLHAKTEGTEFNRFFLPTVNVVKFSESDIEIKFD